MEPIKDCGGRPIPAYITGKVTYCAMEKGALPEGSVYLLKLGVRGREAVMPLAGQFYMLRAMKTGILLGRPISVFHAQKTPHGAELQFLILVKGRGTTELTSLEADDEVQLLGPLGNTFPLPAEKAKVCIVGGGIGVAPVAGFAETLPHERYDFFASFKSGCYGLDYVKAKNLTSTTDDGSVGVHGMLSAAFTAQTLLD